MINHETTTRTDTQTAFTVDRGLRGLNVGNHSQTALRGLSVNHSQNMLSGTPMNHSQTVLRAPAAVERAANAQTADVGVKQHLPDHEDAVIVTHRRQPARQRQRPRPATAGGTPGER
jgi:hypothetical protein